MAYLFTIICEYKGGTYTKQLRAESPFQAFEQWAEIFKTEDFLTVSEKKKFVKAVQYTLTEGSITTLEGLQNVWYEGFSLDDDLLEIIIVGMSGEPVPAGSEKLSAVSSQSAAGLR